MLQTQEAVFDDGYLRVEYDHFYVACRGVPIYAISRKEFLILSCLLRTNGRPISHQEIWRQVWQDEELKDTVLRVHIASIRRKLGPYGIEVVPMIGVGYYLRIVPQELIGLASPLAEGDAKIT